MPQVWCSNQLDQVQLCTGKEYQEGINLLALELYFFNFSTPVYKMRIKQEPNMLEL